ncbi:hypothetical protein J31TS6_40820 [Brevibacillus reuszeri]|uniref:RidA family protein n=1 Tax=Brevibacillus reuszeri TaxID=54915 RepID=UPI001AFFDDB7|nr:RidA family protein [Brevibacillus reuszeri]GIO08054.1 hypothetical protein J31TS6_40820 [Brevibacillus reuszeri]
MGVIETRLEALGLVLPPGPTPMGNYVTCATVGEILYTSGASCFVDGKPIFTGRVGAELTKEQGYEASRVTVLNLLSMIKAHIGELDRIERIVKVLGLVNSSLDFFEQPQVINGASDLLVEIFGEAGKHARSALGTSSLPVNIPVEIEMIVQLKKSTLECN